MCWKRKISGLSVLVFASTWGMAQSMNTGSSHERTKNVKPVENPTNVETQLKANPFSPVGATLKEQELNKTNSSSNVEPKKTEVIYASNDIKPRIIVPVKEQAKVAELKLVPKQKPYMPTSKYDPVPLGGELSYYAHNNDIMLTYIKGYFANFDRRLGSLRSEKKENILKSMDGILDKHDIPRELKYLAVIESALNSGALSPVGARGYWQFMAPTGRMMGLRISGKIDERTDLTKSTHAAAKYLAYLYDEFDDWLLVVASYNSGPRPVINAMKKTGKSDFFSIKKYLPKETQNHVMAFIATATIMERMPHMVTEPLPANYDWKALNVNRKVGEEAKKKTNTASARFTEEELMNMAVLRISKPLDLDHLCKILGADRRQLGKWNFDYFTYLSEYKVGSEYKLRIPKDKLDTYLVNKQKIESVLVDLN